MSNNRTDISQIKKYLAGELDAAARHDLERRAQDDPFLMDALDGYENLGTVPQPALSELVEQLQQRVRPTKVRNLSWKYYSAAAAVLLFLMFGYLIWPGKKMTSDKQLVNNTAASPDKVIVADDSTHFNDRKLAALSEAPPQRQAVIKPVPGQPASADLSFPITTKTDTVEYKAMDYKVRSKTRLPNPVAVGSPGLITFNGNQTAKLKINGKGFNDGSAPQALKNLPAEIIEKIQSVDDYGDQAALKKQNLNKDSAVMKEIVATGAGRLTRGNINPEPTAPQTLQAKVKGVNVTIPPRISGTVYNELGLAMPGVSILMDGTRNATQTDLDGHFSLPADGRHELTVNSLGFQGKHLEASSGDSLQIQLTPAVNALSEIMIIPNDKAHPQKGWQTFDVYLNKNSAQRDPSEGSIVSLTFSITGNGKPGNFIITRSAGKTLDDRAIKLIQNGPAWQGNENGKVETVKMDLTFRSR